MPVPPKEDLENLYYGDFRSQKEIGEVYGVSQKVVFSWFRKLGIKSRIPYKMLDNFTKGLNPLFEGGKNIWELIKEKLGFKKDPQLPTPQGGYWNNMWGGLKQRFGLGGGGAGGDTSGGDMGGSNPNYAGSNYRKGGNYRGDNICVTNIWWIW